MNTKTAAATPRRPASTGHDALRKQPFFGSGSSTTPRHGLLQLGRGGLDPLVELLVARDALGGLLGRLALDLGSLTSRPVSKACRSARGTRGRSSPAARSGAPPRRAVGRAATACGAVLVWFSISHSPVRQMIREPGRRSSLRGACGLRAASRPVGHGVTSHERFCGDLIMTPAIVPRRGPRAKHAAGGIGRAGAEMGQRARRAAGRALRPPRAGGPRHGPRPRGRRGTGAPWASRDRLARMADSRTFALVRHGGTDYNVARRLNGDPRCRST